MDNNLSFEEKVRKIKELGKKIKKGGKNEEKSEGWRDLVNKAFLKLKNEENERFLRLLFDFIKDENKKNLIIIGPPGIGKTYLLENLLVKGRKYWLNAFMVSETDLYEEFKSGNLRKRSHEEKTCDIREYIYEITLRTKILIRDDIGTVEITKAFYPKIKSLLDYRLKKGLKTIFISNFDLSELQDRLDARLFDRLLESHIVCNIVSWSNKRHGGKVNIVEI